MKEYRSDRIVYLKNKLLSVPLKTAVSDAKVIMGKQKALANVFLTCIEIKTENGIEGMGFTYALRAGGYSQYQLANEFAPLLLGEDPNDISRLWDKLSWASNSLGSSGLATQTISAFDMALWDIKGKRASLPLNKLLGSYRETLPCYNTSGGYLQAPIEEVVKNAKKSLAQGIGGIKLKVGQADYKKDVERVRILRQELGDNVPIMIDANQQWDLSTALRVGEQLDKYNLTWLEEPLNAHDVQGHYKLTQTLKTPIGTGEMLSSVAEISEFIECSAVDLIMPDAMRLGGITPFLNVMSNAAEKRLMMAPHFVMELHLSLAATYPLNAWVEHIEWLQPVFNERIKMKNGEMFVSAALGNGLSLNEKNTQGMLLMEKEFSIKNKRW